MRLIYMVPIGIVRGEVCQDIAEKLSEFFSFPVKILDRMGEPRYAFIPARRQYSSAAILEEITGKNSSSGGKIIGITNVDLCTPILTFVFGAAQLSGRAALVSLFRLRPEFYGFGMDEKLFLKRCIKEAIHELAHVFGMIHCRQAGCVMHLANSIKDIDRKGTGFCASCEELFKKKAKEWQDE